MICPACQSETDEKNEVCPACGQALAGGPTLARGSVVAARYEILAPLGKGGMGMVFKARDRVLDETVALKILRADVARAPEMERRFRSEIKLARRVRHRNVCGIHEYGEDGGLRYIAMELVEGTDLKHFLREKGALPVPQAFEVAIQLTHGLEAIHEAGVVHRDLKTSNVMLDRLGRVRLMDFGIAKQLGSDVTLAGTGLGTIIGTPEYMSPEQARGEKLDLRSDIYALGILLYEIFTGHVPFRGDTPIATIFKTLEQAPDLEGPSAAGIPAPLVPVLAKALAKDPAQRYATAREMMEALRAAAGRETLPEPSTIPAAQPATSSMAPTPVPAPTLLSRAKPPAGPSSDASIGPTAILDPRGGDVEPTFILRNPDPEAPRPRAGASLSGVAARRPPARRSVWPWMLAGGVFLSLAAAAIVFVVHNLVRTRGSTASPGARPPRIAKATTKPVSPPPRNVDTPTPEPSPVPLAPTFRAAAPTSPPAARSARPLPSPNASRRVSESRSRSPSAPVPVASPDPPVTTSSEVQSGLLQVKVTPWADVRVDDTEVGTTPFKPLVLSAGSHTIQLIHPDYKVLQRKVTIRGGETTRLEIDLAWEAVPRRP